MYTISSASLVLASIPPSLLTLWKTEPRLPDCPCHSLGEVPSPERVIWCRTPSRSSGMGWRIDNNELIASLSVNGNIKLDWNSIMTLVLPVTRAGMFSGHRLLKAQTNRTSWA